MLNKITGVFLQPYPFDAHQLTPLRRVIKSSAEGFFIALFLIIFEPFNINNWQDPNKIYYLIGFGLITTFSTIFLRLAIIPALPTFFNEEKWTVGREIITILLLLVIIAIGNFVFLSLVLHDTFSLSNFFWSFVFVILIGLFPVSFGVISNYIYQLKKYQKPVAVKHHTEAEVVSKLELVAENGKDTFEVLEANLLFIESADNYAVIHYAEGESLKKELLRSSLTRLEKQIGSENIVRCHRSFIVNLNRVEEVTGNAQGYKFHLQPLELIVPVARKYSELVKMIS